MYLDSWKITAGQVDQISVRLLMEALPESDRWVFRESRPGTKMILLHQTMWQRQMLVKYGNTVTCMDATYKTNEYAFPLFVVTVVDNHGAGIPVAFFMVESENQCQITEALEL